MWGNEFRIGSTAYLGQKLTWNAATNFGFEFHTDKNGTNIHVGDLGRTLYKKVSGTIPMIMNLGAAGYAQFKVTGDSGSDIPPGLVDSRTAFLPSVRDSTYSFPTPVNFTRTI